MIYVQKAKENLIILILSFKQTQIFFEKSLLRFLKKDLQIGFCR